MALLGRGVPIQPHNTYPRDFPGPAGAIRLSRFRYGLTADTPAQYGYGVPLAAQYAIPRAATAVALLGAVRYGSDPTAPMYPVGYGIPSPAQYTIPRSYVPSSVISLVPASYGSIAPPIPAGFGVPVQPHIMVPRDWTPTPILTTVRYGSPVLPPAPQGYGLSLPPYVTIPRDWSTPVVVLLGAVRYGSVPLLAPVGYGTPLVPHVYSAAPLIAVTPPATVPFGTLLGTSEFYGKTADESWNDAAYRYWSAFVP